MSKVYYVLKGLGDNITGYVDSQNPSTGTPVTVTDEQEADFLENFIWYKLDGQGGIVKMDETEFYSYYPNARPKTTKELFEELAGNIYSIRQTLETMQSNLYKLADKF